MSGKIVAMSKNEKRMFWFSLVMKSFDWCLLYASLEKW